MIDRDEYIGDPPGYDPTGGAAREDRALVRVWLSGQLEIPTRVPRTRGGKVGSKAGPPIHRTIELAVQVPPTALDGPGGLAELTAALARAFYSRLAADGWPPIPD